MFCMYKLVFVDVVYCCFINYEVILTSLKGMLMGKTTEKGKPALIMND